jgi:diguanylate cyclase (GGDEF)-like protein
VGPGDRPRAGRSTVVAATLVLAATVVVLSGLAFVELGRMADSARTVERSARLQASYETLQRAIANEAFAEAGYRRAPTAAARQRLLGSFDAVEQAGRTVARAGSTSDRAAVLYLQALNTRYTAQVRDAIAEGAEPPSTEKSDLVAGPALDAMQHLVDAALRRTGEASAAAVSEQRHLIGLLRWLVPVVLTGVVAALVLAWSLLLRQHRRATAEAERSEHLALHDALTGAANRRGFERALDAALADRPLTATVCLFDLDEFKEINDTYGHDVGDQVLQVVARRLRAAVRPGDVVARLGGDEFAAVVHGSEGREQLVQRLRRAVLAPLHVGELLLHPGVSAGAADLWEGATQAEVLREADRQLYERKRARKRAGESAAPFAG